MPIPSIEGALINAIQKSGLATSLNETKNAKLDRAVNTGRRESAAGNVFTVGLQLSEEEESRLIEIVNSRLPEDVFVMAFSYVSSSFFARSEPKILTYRYFLFSEGLSLPAMQEAAALFKGAHNFRRFLNSQYDKIQVNPVVNVLSSKIVVLEQNSDFTPVAYYEISASAFFTNLVCSIMSLIKAVGRGEKQLCEIEAFLQPTSNDSCLLVAESSSNLILYDVQYKNLSFKYSKSSASVVNRCIAGTMEGLKKTFCVLRCINNKWDSENLDTRNTSRKDESL